MKIILFYNSSSGKIKNSPDLLGFVKKALKDNLEENDSLKTYDVVKNNEQEILENEKDENTKVFIAGGDGTISKVVNNIIDFDFPIGVLPLGTFNNFCKTLKLSQHVDKAVSQLLDGKEKKIDLGKVNERYFINNSSVGAYTKMVEYRQESQMSFNLDKRSAMFLSLIKSILLFPLIKVSLISNKINGKAKTPVTMISNNKYKFRLDAIGERKSLTEGLLYIYMIKCRSRFCVIKIFLKGILNKLNHEKYFELISSKKITLKIYKKSVDVSADGEIYKMKPPLVYEICPKCLTVIVPKSYE